MQPATSPRTSSSVSGIQHDERILDAPVGGVGHVRHAREAVERDVVPVRRARRARAAPSRGAPRSPGTSARTASTAALRRRDQLRHAAVALGLRVAAARAHSPAGASRSRAAGAAAPRPAAAGASDCRGGRPAGTDCARRPRCRPAPRTASAPSGRCAARRAARSSSRHIGSPEQADHDLAIGERRVVVGDLAQPRRVGGGILRCSNAVGDGIHGAPSLPQCNMRRTCRIAQPLAAACDAPTPPSRARPCRSRRRASSRTPPRTPRPRSDA